jgi:transcriptional regulator with XRE-family HTH domain
MRIEGVSESELKKSFGERMFFLREHNHFTQEKLAELIVCSTTFERELEKGREGPSFKMLPKLAQAFKIDIIDLFQFDESIPQERMTEAVDKEKLSQLFGARLRFLRNIRQHTQREVARGTSLTEKFVYKMEKGKQAASFNTLAKLAEFLDVEVKELFRFGKSFPQDRHSDS